MKEFIPPSGKKVKVIPASFAVSMKLKNTIMTTLAKNGIDLKGFDVSKMSLKQEINADLLNTLITTVMAVDGNDEVVKVLFECMSVCTHDHERITEATFEDEGARGDYYPIAIEVIKANLLPFFKGLVSALNAGTVFTA